MSFDKYLEKKGLTLGDDNSLPKDQRQVRNFKRVIAAVRAAESEANDEIREARSGEAHALRQVAELQARVRLLEAENLSYRMREELSSDKYNSLTVADKRLLEKVAS